jgi:RimJ/RimL family protein N-acetyltransferase
MGLRRIGLITDADNLRGVRCYEKAGFVREGLLRAHRLRYGQPIDMLTMAVLKEDWESPGA